MNEVGLELLRNRLVGKQGAEVPQPRRQLHQEGLIALNRRRVEPVHVDGALNDLAPGEGAVSNIVIRDRLLHLNWGDPVGAHLQGVPFPIGPLYHEFPRRQAHQVPLVHRQAVDVHIPCRTHPEDGVPRHHINDLEEVYIRRSGRDMHRVDKGCIQGADVRRVRRNPPQIRLHGLDKPGIQGVGIYVLRVYAVKLAADSPQDLRNQVGDPHQINGPGQLLGPEIALRAYQVGNGIAGRLASRNGGDDILLGVAQGYRGVDLPKLVPCQLHGPHQDIRIQVIVMEGGGVPQAKPLQPGIMLILQAPRQPGQGYLVGNLGDLPPGQLGLAQGQQLLGIVNIIIIDIALLNVAVVVKILAVDVILAVIDRLKVGVLVSPDVQARNNRIKILRKGDLPDIAPGPDGVAAIRAHGLAQVDRKIVKDQLPAPKLKHLLLDGGKGADLEDIQVIQHGEVYIHRARRKGGARQDLGQGLPGVDAVRCGGILLGLDVDDVVILKVVGDMGGLHLHNASLSRIPRADPMDPPQLPPRLDEVIWPQ